ncbi:MAG: IPTL-CTERM sorting domain-containing protein [Acidobacteriota bacterium]
MSRTAPRYHSRTYRATVSGLALLLAALPFQTLTPTAIAQPSPTAGLESIAEDGLPRGAVDSPPPSALGGIVFSTYPGISPSPAFATSVVETTDLPFPEQPSVIEADDFTVGGHGWRIDTVEVRGVYIDFLGNSGPAASVNVYFLPDGGAGFPATTDVVGGAVKAYPARSYTDVDDGDFRVVLVDDDGNPDPLVLTPGTYWLAVQPVMALLSNGLWGWTESSAAPDTGTTIGAESVWMQSVGLIQSTDTVVRCDQGSWRRRVTDCLITRPGDAGPFERDAAFRFIGEALSPGAELSATAVQTSEAGVTASFTVALEAPPNAPVAIPVGAAPAGEGTVSTTSFSFDAGNWDQPQTVTVTPVDDGIPEASMAYSIALGPASSPGDPGYDGLILPAVAVENLDDDSAGIAANPLNDLAIAESGTTETLALSLIAPLAPGETVTVPLSVSPAGIASVPASVVFTEADGTNPRNVTVTPIDDLVFDQDSPFTVVTGDPTSNNPIYDALGATDLPDISGLREENDVVGAVVTPDATPLTTDESGTTASFSVVLTSEPLAAVNIELFSSDVTEGTLSTAVLSFDAGNWDMPQTVTVTGQADDFDDNDLDYTISLLPDADSADPFYAVFDPNDVAAVNLDDDTAGFTIVPLDVVVAENGAESLVAIRLTAQAAFDAVPVTLPLTVDDASEAEISVDGGPFADNATLEWQQDEWQDDRLVTIRGVDDELLDGDIFFRVETGDPVGGDLSFAALTAEDVLDIQGLNVDDETVVEVPTLGNLGLALVSLLLALSAFGVLRRRS